MTQTAHQTASLAPAEAWLNAPLRWLGHQQWLRYGLRDRLLCRLRNPQRSAPRAFEAPFAGYVYPGNLSRWIDWIVYFYGAYEQDELELMRALMRGRASPIALDIGANVGHHTLYMASFCGEVHAFEPYEGVSRCIDEKVARNQLQHVHVHRVGLSNENAELMYYAPQGCNTGTGTFVAEHESHNNMPLGRLRLVHADPYLAELALPRVDLIKIDVEGFEITVVKGLRKTLEQYRPVVMLELSDEVREQFKDAADFMRLFPSDYRVDVVRSRRSAFGVFGRKGCELLPLRWQDTPSPGGYVNLLLRPAS